MRRGLKVLACVLLGACAVEPVARSATNNAEISVSTLFTHDGCSVYRFYDDGRYHYYTRCGDATTTTTSWTESCGKGCTRTHVDEIPTVKRRPRDDR